MKTVETYQAPQVEVIEVEVEQGFAASFRIGGGMGATETIDDGYDGNITIGF